jgi:hypothetical protein
MSPGTWDPDSEKSGQTAEADSQTLERLASYSEAGQLDQLEQLMTPAQVRRIAGLMRLDHDLWQAAIAHLSEDQLLHLVRFFAVAENLPGCEAGPRSPVIPLAKALRQRGVRLDRDLLQWLRKVNDNRFLPYGPL